MTDRELLHERDELIAALQACVEVWFAVDSDHWTHDMSVAAVAARDLLARLP
jgi:hypothetical protein